jgi:hypothetical protein
MSGMSTTHSQQSCGIYIVLIGGLEHVLFFHSIGNFIIPTDELIFFRGVETTNQYSEE